MDTKEREKEKRISMLEVEGETLDRELSNQQKKAAIREARALYGKDWKKTLLGVVKSLRINKETLQTLHGMGVDNSLRELNDPRSFRR